MILSILLFFAIEWGLGFSIAKLVGIKETENAIAKNLIRLGLGLGLFPMLSVTLNLIKIPLTWWIFLSLSFATPLVYLVKSKKEGKEKIPIKFDSSTAYIFVVLLISLVLFAVYLKGAFGYPYLENDDPWGHTIGSSYVAEHKSFSRYVNEPLTEENFIRTYMEPYPPAYDTLMGVLHQTNDSIKWTLKFFNVLIIALGLVFFYFFAKEFAKSEKKALTATFILAVLPCFMSHFIWAQTLALVLFFPALYCSEKIKENKKWTILAALIIASIFVSQPSSAVFFVIMFIVYWLSKMAVSYFSKENTLTQENNLLILSLFAGAILSMIYWIPTLIKYGLKLMLRGVGIVVGLFGAESIDTSGGVVYSIKDYAIAPLVSKMDQPTGFGIFVFLLVLFSLFLLCFNLKKIKTSHYIMTIIIWFVFTLIGTEGNALPFKLFPHRLWAFLAIPVAFLVAEVIFSISASLKNPSIKYVVLLAIIAGILWTSAYPKYYVETSMWPPGVTWSSGEELTGYLWLETNMPKNTPIFNFCSHEGKLLAFGMYIPPYDPDLHLFQKGIENKTIDDIHSITKKYNFDYVILDGYCVRKIGINQTNDLLQQFANSANFQLTYSTQGMWLFKVKN